MTIEYPSIQGKSYFDLFNRTKKNFKWIVRLFINNLTIHLKFFLKTHGVFYIENLLAKAMTFIYLANRLKCIIISNSKSLDSLQLPVSLWTLGNSLNLTWFLMRKRNKQKQCQYSHEFMFNKCTALAILKFMLKFMFVCIPHSNR